MRIPILPMLALLFAVAFGAHAQPLPKGLPEDAGMSAERLAHLSATMQRAVDEQQIPGAVVMIAREGRLVYSGAFGWRDRQRNAPMAEDSIFRIYSMTKPVVSVAAMMLVEEGHIGLHEPVSKYIPEFRDAKVGTDLVDQRTGTSTFTVTEATRQITVQDLLRHTSGLTYGAFTQKTTVQEMYKRAGLWSQKWVLEDFVRTLARIPLQYEPGTVWEYGHSTDVLGRVVEVASGMPLDRFLAQRIFLPLRMVDTGFHAPEEKHERLAQPMQDPATGRTPELIDVRQPATFFAGGHGLVSTAGDYLRFSQMLANGGALDGVRILGPRTVQYMAADHLGSDIGRGTGYLPGPGYGFGLGFASRLATGESNWPGTVGEFFWGGYAGTYFWIDPQEALVAVLMTQEPAQRQHYRVMLRNLVYQAIIE
jgi:CubicO group peptidase (beta-lactamase class C family)